MHSFCRYVLDDLCHHNGQHTHTSTHTHIHTDKLKKTITKNIIYPRSPPITSTSPHRIQGAEAFRGTPSPVRSDANWPLEKLQKLYAWTGRRFACRTIPTVRTYVRVFACGVTDGDVFGIKICMCIVCGAYLRSYWGGVILGRGYIGTGSYWGGVILGWGGVGWGVGIWVFELEC